MVMLRVFESTADGSGTLYVPELDEHYHSVKGAYTESKHIFIEMGLAASTAPSPHVLEVGLGTGLNALLAWQWADEMQRSVHYTALERYPLTWQEISQLKYQHATELEQIHSACWEQDVMLSPYFTLHKIQCDAITYLHQQPTERFDVVFFDAFAPEKQPELWSESIFQDIYRTMNADGLLTTYCAKGCIRRLLQSIGFVMERLPGPPGGKREMLRGGKLIMNFEL